jgi:UDP-N-acetylglucosamine--N-acetylmuramyl-(pentapeptide) pyrophosphoryl-undecaprenol N-acetylglucosamine transferase
LRLVIAGGGTGGHVLPALAVLEAFAGGGQAVEARWLGSRDGIERDAAARAGVPFRAIPTGKLRRYLSAQTPLDLARIPAGAVQAWRDLHADRPDVLFSTGGFVSVPTVVAARLAGGIPILTHEQTAILGLATRINLRAADVLAVSYDATAAMAGGTRARVVVTGNPVRASLRGGDADRGRARFGFSPELPVLYVTGGARGASPLNQRLAALLPDLLETYQVLHQAGPASANADASELASRRETWSAVLRDRYRVVEFVRDELADVYAAADLVLGRAGAGTVAELAYLGKPAVLIPLPGTGGDEQTHNGRLLADAGGAVLLPQGQATPDRLRAELSSLLADAPRRASMAARARAVGRPDAAAALADELLALAGKG